MPVRGTRNLFGKAAQKQDDLVRLLEGLASEEEFQRFIPSSLCEASLFAGRTGDNRMFHLQTLGDHELVLIPEVTGIVIEEFRNNWSKELPKPVKVFYSSRCYRYDRPQRGRYREFTQFGVECLPNTIDMVAFCNSLLTQTGLKNFEIRRGVKRGLAYYNADGFEIWADNMQLVGGGPYEEGAGFAVGVERLLLALENTHAR